MYNEYNLGQWVKRRLKRTHKMQADEENIKVCLSREDALCQSKWIVGVIQIATRLK